MFCASAIMRRAVVEQLEREAQYRLKDQSLAKKVLGELKAVVRQQSSNPDEAAADMWFEAQSQKGRVGRSPKRARKASQDKRALRAVAEPSARDHRRAAETTQSLKPAWESPFKDVFAENDRTAKPGVALGHVLAFAK